MTLVLGLDIGSTTTKACLVSLTDAVTVVRVARQSTPARVADLIATAAAVARECAAGASRPIAAVGIASMAESGAALDARGEPLTPLLRWDRDVDRSHLDALLARHPLLPETTGIPATKKPTAVALTALRAESPEVFRAMRHWAGVADLVVHALTGVRATDHTLAARTMMAGTRADAWDATVLDGLGIEPEVMAAIRAPGDPASVTTSAAESFGLPAGVPVFVAGHDHAVGAWASGVRAPGSVADSLGTAEAIVRVTDAADAARATAAGFAVGRTVDGTGLTVLGGSPACGALFAWWDAAYPHDAALAALGDMPASAWQVSPTLVLPYPVGRQCPAPDPAATVRVLGDTGDAETRSRGLLQSLIAHARWMRESIDAIAGSRAIDVTVIGSLAERVPAWAPLIAASGISTRLCAAEEPVAAGAALLAGVRADAASPDLALRSDDVAAEVELELDTTYRRFLDAVLSQGEQ